MKLTLSKSTSITLIYLFVVLSEWLATFLPLPMGIRHIALMSLPLFLGNFSKVDLRALKYFIILSLIAVLSYFYGRAALFNFFVGYFFTFFFFFIYFVFFNIQISQKEVYKTLKIILFINVALSITSLLEGLLNNQPLRYFPGLFRESAAYATTMSVSVVIALVLNHISKKQFFLNLAIYFTIIVFLTTIKKAIFVSALTWMFYQFFFSNSKKSIFMSGRFWLTFLTIGFVSFAAIYENIEKNIRYLENVGAEEHVRLGMYIASGDIAYDHFPLGSGLGTFGSLASIINDPVSDGYFDYQINPIYQEYGVASLAGNSEIRLREGGNTILDTYWPHITAELGIFGLIILLMYWGLPIFRNIKSIRKIDNPILKGAKFYIICVYSSIFVEGLALIQPEVPFFIFFHSGLSAILIRNIIDKNEGIKI